MTDPDLGAHTYTYDRDGNLVQSVDARGSAGTVFAGYHGLDRPIWRNTTMARPTPTTPMPTSARRAATWGVGRLTSSTLTVGAPAIRCTAPTMAPGNVLTQVSRTVRR
jgi:YD repeat-containing protein